MPYAVLIGGKEIALFGLKEDANNFINQQLDADDDAEIVEVAEVG